MKKVISFSLALVAILAMSVSVFAQGGGGGGRQGGQQGGQQGGRQMGGMQMMGGGGLGQLANNAEAVKAIGLSEQQVADITATVRESRPQGGQGGGERPDPATMRANQEALQKKLEGIVTADQLKKAQTISFQMAGGLDGWPRPEGQQGPGGRGGMQQSALNNEFAMGALGLTDDQKKKFAEIQAKVREAMPRPGQGGQGEDMRAAFEKMQEVREAANKEITALLTDEQKASAKKLIEDAPAFVKPENRQQQQRGGNAREGSEQYRPGEGTWTPGQGAGGQRREARGAFPAE